MQKKNNFRQFRPVMIHRPVKDKFVIENEVFVHEDVVSDENEAVETISEPVEAVEEDKKADTKAGKKKASKQD